ncbi:hypothetical protein AAY473_004620 [Plecturocebus cupreus]
MQPKHSRGAQTQSRPRLRCTDTTRALGPSGKDQGSQGCGMFGLRPLSFTGRNSQSRLLVRLRQENRLTPGDKGCNELRSCY